MTSAIAVDQLVVARGGREVLHGLSLDVARGSVTGLLGPSGSGKTTLMRAIAGVQIVASGEVRVLGEPAGSARVRRRLGYVTQAPSIYLDLTARENVAHFARLVGAPSAAVARALTTVGLADVAGAVTARLSGGQRGRVSLAAALVGEPDVLVLDEPTVGLDPVLRRDLWATFHALAADGTTLLVSSHVMDEAERCHELVLMRDGHVLASGSPAALLQRTGARDVEAAFLTLVEHGEPA